MFYVKQSVSSVAGRSFPSLEIEIPPRRKYIDTHTHTHTHTHYMYTHVCIMDIFYILYFIYFIYNM